MIKTGISYIIIFFYLALIARPAYSSDFSFSVVKLGGFSGKIYSESFSRYRIESSESELSLPDTPFQRIEKKGSDGGIFFLQVLSGKFNDKGPADPGDNLSETMFLDFNNPEILKLKKRFAGSKDIVNDVERFVFSAIKSKKMGISLLPASEILKSGAGDCTEHSVLGAAILRSMGVPSRAVVGMILAEEFGEYRNVFVYHMWVEAFVKGEWVLFDATRPGGMHHNRYIALAYHHLKTGMPLSFLKAVSAMREFTVRYISQAGEAAP